MSYLRYYELQINLFKNRVLIDSNSNSIYILHLNFEQ
jgi:hypothetical protein